MSIPLGALADPNPLLKELADSAIETHVEDEILGFNFPNFSSAWEALALVTTAHLPVDQQKEAQRTVRDVMYPNYFFPRVSLSWTSRLALPQISERYVDIGWRISTSWISSHPFAEVMLTVASILFYVGGFPISLGGIHVAAFSSF